MVHILDQTFNFIHGVMTYSLEIMKLGTNQHLIDFAEISESTDLASIRVSYSKALTSLDYLDVSDEMKIRLASLLDELLRAHLGICQSLDPLSNPVRTHTACQPGYIQFTSRRKQVNEQLKALIAQLELGIPHPSGYTAEVLMRTAGIKKTLWQEIRKKAGITIKRGNSNRHFTNREVRTKLIPSALAHSTSKSRAAANKWREMLDEDKRGS